MINEEKFKKILNETYMADFFLKSFNKEDWDLGHSSIPKPLPYYISRKITQKRRLNPALFKHNCSDIFVFEGIEHHHLSILARPELTDTSSDQLRKITRRFILLDHPDDFNEITKIAKNNVHRIKHEDGQFYWLSTTGSCQMITVFLTNDVEEISEISFIKDHLSTFNNRPIAICSSPGMGKSVLLANLENQLKMFYPKRITMFLQLRSLIPKLSSFVTEISWDNIKQLLTSSTLISQVGKYILLDFLHSKDLIFEIFLDGFDEISCEHLQLAKQFLKCLMTCPNIRTYITSRPHMQNEIENTLEVVSLDILPFNEEHQVNFLREYWTLEQKNTNCEKLSRFAMTVLVSLEFINQSTSSEIEFAGIPLQCYMLAQVYSNQAKMYCNRENFNFQATNSLYNLYNKFMNYRFQNIKENEKQVIKIYHWKEALILLFPDNQVATEIIQLLASRLGSEDTPWGKVFAVGILEYESKKPNFVHRTFAEYLLAEFIVEELLINEIVDINISMTFIIEYVFCLDASTKGHIISGKSYNFNAYFHITY